MSTVKILSLERFAFIFPHLLPFVWRTFLERSRPHPHRSRRLLRFEIRQRGLPCGFRVLLRNQQPAYLHQLAGLIAGKLVGRLYRLHHPLRALRSRLKGR